MKGSHRRTSKRRIVLLAVIIAVVVVACVLVVRRAGKGADPLELLLTYTPPENQYPFPEFITEGLPDGFEAGEPTIQQTTYPDGTPVTVGVVGYTRDEELVIVQVLNVCGDNFINNTPELEAYTFKLVRLSGNRVARYSKGEEMSGYVWYYGKYSIAVYTSPAGFPGYLTDFAKLYLAEYPSHL